MRVFVCVCPGSESFSLHYYSSYSLGLFRFLFSVCIQLYFSLSVFGVSRSQEVDPPYDLGRQTYKNRKSSVYVHPIPS